MSSYKIILSDEFIRITNKIENEHPRIHESILGASWRLSRSPKEGEILGPPLSDKYRVLVVGPPIKGFYRVWIYYKLEEDANKIIFVDIIVPK